MKNKIKPPRLFVSPNMFICFKDLLGEQARIPRNPNKFLRKFIKNSREESFIISTLFKKSFMDKDVYNNYDILKIIIDQSDFMEKLLAVVYDDCCQCTRFYSRYRRQIQKQIDIFVKYSFQARTVLIDSINKNELRVINSN